MLNRGDTVCLLLNYSLNGDPLQEGAYQEIELQINKQGIYNAVKKTLSDGSIVWGEVSYLDDEGQAQTFTGYYANLSQEETFRLSSGASNIQLRIMLNDEVGSSAISSINLGQVLSSQILGVSAD